MITVDDAMNRVAEYYPDSEIIQGFIYKHQFYVFELFNGRVTHDSPFVSVTRNTGKLALVNPTEDIDRFFSDKERHRLEV